MGEEYIKGTKDSNHVPTEYQDKEASHVPTEYQSPDASHVPTEYQDSDASHIPTEYQGSLDAEHVPTMYQDAGSEAAKYAGNRILSHDIEFTGNNQKKYIIEASEKIHVASGESEIYKALDSYGNRYVARLLTTVRPFDKERSRKRKHVIDFLKENSTDKNNHLLPLIDEGKIDGNGGEYFIEIYPYCIDGDLSNKCGRLNYEFIKDTVIPDINEALHAIHEKGFIHRDVKPDNLYLYGGSVVLGDFGIMTEQMDAAHNLDLDKIGSLGYYAPELNGGSYAIESDYYSFGQTIFTLYTGHLMYQEDIDRHAYDSHAVQRNAVFQRALKDDFSLEDIKEDELRTLISGLLQSSLNMRFGYDEVERWVDGDSETLKHSLMLDDYGDDYMSPLIINRKTIWNDTDLYNYIPGHEEIILKYLYESDFTHFFRASAGRNEEAEEVEKIRRIYSGRNRRTERDNILALADLSLFLSKGRKLYCDGKLFDSFQSFSRELEGKPDYDCPVWYILKADVLSKWYGKREGAKEDKDSEDRRKSIYNISVLAGDDNTRSIAWYYAYFLLTPEKENRKVHDFEKAGDYIASIMDIKNPGKFYYNDPTLDAEVLGKFCFDGYINHIQGIIQSFSAGNMSEAYQLFFEFLDKCSDDGLAENKNIFRKFYCVCGPNGGLYYWKQNIDSYIAEGIDAAGIIEKIKAVKLDPASSIEDQAYICGEIERIRTEFNQYFNDNYLLSLSGFKKVPSINNNYIYTDDVNGYFSFVFMGHPAPLGYKRLLGM